MGLWKDSFHWVPEVFLILGFLALDSSTYWLLPCTYKKTASRETKSIFSKFTSRRLEGATVNPTEGPSLTYLQTINAREGVEKREPFADQGVNWRSHCGRWYAASAAKLLQSCPTLCDPIDGSPPGSLVPGILQARTLEWVAISFSSAWSGKWKWSRSVVSDSSTPWPAAYQAPASMGFSRQEYWSGVPSPSPLSKLGGTYSNLSSCNVPNHISTGLSNRLMEERDIMFC